MFLKSDIIFMFKIDIGIIDLIIELIIELQAVKGVTGIIMSSFKSIGQF